MSKVYIYVVDRDLGFAPNPFHGYCSLATCKPRIRNVAKIGDWILGVGGRRLKATGRCVYAMKVTQKLTFNEYWEDPKFSDKKPVRNGSKKMILGDNIYFYDKGGSAWQQTHSHHSNPDGSINYYNLETDTQSSNVLISKHFYYFGDCAPIVPENIFLEMGYKNGRNHRVFDYSTAINLVKWIEIEHADSFNLVSSDPFNFDKSEAHYSVKTNRIT